MLTNHERRRIVREYLAAGYDLIPIRRGSKAPGKGWRTCEPLTLGEALAHDGELGVRPHGVQLVIDVDVKADRGGLESWRRWKSETGLAGSDFRRVRTPSGGIHLYALLPRSFANRKLRKSVRDYPGIDWLTEGCGSQAVACGSFDGAYRWFMSDRVTVADIPTLRRDAVAFLIPESSRPRIAPPVDIPPIEGGKPPPKGWRTMHIWRLARFYGVRKPASLLSPTRGILKRWQVAKSLWEILIEHGAPFEVVLHVLDHCPAWREKCDGVPDKEDVAKGRIPDGPAWERHKIQVIRQLIAERDAG